MSPAGTGFGVAELYEDAGGLTGIFSDGPVYPDTARYTNKIDRVARVLILMSPY